MKVLVTGATGFIGSALTKRLRKDGVDVRALCRSAKKGEFLESVGAEIAIGDLQDARSLAQAVTGCDVVYHVGAALSGGAMLQYNINVQGTRDLLKAAQKARVGRLVNVSSIAVYGPDVEGTINEDYPLRQPRNDFYMQSKAMAEKTIWQYSQKTGFPVTNIRPAMVYGVGSGFWSERMYRLVKQYGLLVVNGGTANAHPIHVDDVVDLLTVLGTHDDAVGKSFNCAPDPAPTWREYFGYFAAMAGNTNVIDVPDMPIRAIAPAVTLITRFLGEPVNVSGFLNFLTKQVTYSMKQAQSVLQWVPKVSLKEGMASSEDWLKGTI